MARDFNGSWEPKQEVLVIGIFTLCMVLMGWQASATVANPIVEQFIETQRELSIDYFTSNLENSKALLSCVEGEKTCFSAKVYGELGEQEVILEFDQPGLIDFIKSRHREYRLAVGLHSFSAIEKGLAIGRGKMAITPIHGTQSMFFDTQSEAGKQEWETIQGFMENEISEITDFNNFLSTASTVLPEANVLSMRDMLELKIRSMSEKYPLLMYLPKSEINNKDIKTAFKRLNRKYSKTIKHIGKLKGDDRFELFGFVTILEKAMEFFSEEEQQAIDDYFTELEQQRTILKQVKAILTSRNFWMVMACWSAAILVPPVAILCGAIGLSIALPGVAKLAQQVNRLQSFKGTGSFEQETYARYMTGAFLSGAMYVVLLKSSIPGFVKNVASAKKSVRTTRRKIKILGGRAFASFKRFKQGEIELVKGYFKYYLKDLGSEGATELFMQKASDVGLRTILPNVQRSFQYTANQISHRSPAIFLYSDFLRIMKAVSI